MMQLVAVNRIINGVFKAPVHGIQVERQWSFGNPHMTSQIKQLFYPSIKIIPCSSPHTIKNQSRAPSNKSHQISKSPRHVAASNRTNTTLKQHQHHQIVNFSTLSLPFHASTRVFNFQHSNTKQRNAN